VIAYCYRGGLFAAGLLTCALLPRPVTGQTNLSSAAGVSRSRDDKSAVVNLAIQAVQQLQSQQQATLAAVEQARQQAEATSRRQAQSIASLRRFLFVLSAGMCVAVAGLWLYIRSLLHALGRRGPLTALLRRAQAPDAAALVRKGATLEHGGRLEDALAAYEQALALDPTLSQAYVGQGNVLNRLDRYEEALACFEKAAAHHPHIPHPVVVRGESARA